MAAKKLNTLSTEQMAAVLAGVGVNTNTSVVGRGADEFLAEYAAKTASGMIEVASSFGDSFSHYSELNKIKRVARSNERQERFIRERFEAAQAAGLIPQ